MTSSWSLQISKEGSNDDRYAYTGDNRISPDNIFRTAVTLSIRSFSRRSSTHIEIVEPIFRFSRRSSPASPLPSEMERESREPKDFAAAVASASFRLIIFINCFFKILDFLHVGLGGRSFHPYYSAAQLRLPRILSFLYLR